MIIITITISILIIIILTNISWYITYDCELFTLWNIFIVL